MSSRDIICRVRALYAYESSDPSSLSFQPDAIIEVLAQLESGWWDGWSNGRRGWFPSNYVQVIPEEEDEQDLQQWRYQQQIQQQQLQIQQLQQQQQQLQDQRRQREQREQYRMSVQSTSPWVLQTTEDGSEQYYYNVHTQEMRYSMPPEDDVIPPMRPVRAANRVIAADRQSIVHDDFEELPPNWVRKITPRGRYYYCNVKTEETTWNLEDIDLDTGVLITTTTSPKSSIYSYNDTNTVLSDDDSSLSWHSLATLIAQSIIHLKDSVRQENSNQFNEDTTLIVHRIRLLLYVTNCLDKETSIHLKTSKQLRTLHRGLLASVAKLVLATKVASSTWPTPDSLHKLQSDADECLIAVRNFISHAQELHIEFKESTPTLTFDTNTKSTIKAEPLTTILILADNVRGALTSYWESVREAYLPFENHDIQGTLTKLKANAPLLVAQFRNLSNTASQFLDAIDADSRKPIYEAMGTLFIVSQAITKGDLDGEQLVAANTSLIDCTRGIEDGIEQIIENAEKMQPFMLDTRDTPTPTQRHVMLEPRDTPTPTQRQVMLEPRDTPTPTQHHIEPTYMHGAEELVNNIRNMTVETLDDTSSFHSDLTATTQQQQVRKDDKIAKFFGEDTIAAARQRDTLLGTPSNASVISVNSSAASTLGTEFASILGSDVDPNEMVINLEGNVKGGTLHGLVVYLTQHDQLDSKFNTTFLLTYRSFCTTQELFNELFNRYQTPPPEGIKSDELELWKERKLKLIRLRVFNVIKSWLETYFNDEEDHHILPEIDHFTDNVIVESMKFGAEQLSKLIKKRMSAEDSSQIRKMKLNVRTGDMPVPILPKNMKRIKLLELDPHELARQMTIMDFRLYNRIKPVECLDKNWGKTELDDQGHHIAANVKSSIEHSNQVTAWVTDSILSKEEVKKRAGVLKHWILVAERCRLLNNYNTCMAILSAFDNGSIGRMKRTWELISARTMQILQNIRRLMGANRNFSEYRDLIHKVNPPCIPFLGIYLQDLTFIEDGNSNFLKKSNSLINFAKRMKTAEVIRDLQQYQSTHYMLTAVPDIQEFIKTHLHSSREEEELYNLSLKLEPRERGEDTIARRLKESGL